MGLRLFQRRKNDFWERIASESYRRTSWPIAGRPDPRAREGP